jgi:hypothetical protein
MKMLGRLGWFGQCSCCNGPRGKHEMKRLEERQWRREQATGEDWDALDWDAPPVVTGDFSALLHGSMDD